MLLEASRTPAAAMKPSNALVAWTMRVSSCARRVLRTGHDRVRNVTSALCLWPPTCHEAYATRELWPLICHEACATREHLNGALHFLRDPGCCSLWWRLTHAYKVYVTDRADTCKPSRRRSPQGAHRVHRRGSRILGYHESDVDSAEPAGRRRQLFQDLCGRSTAKV